MTKSADIQRVHREGKLIRTRILSVRTCASLSRHMRVGLIVPRYGHSAVERNRLKRRLRELARRELLPLGLILDVVLRCLEPAYAAGFEELCDAVRRVGAQLARAGAVEHR